MIALLLAFAVSAEPGHLRLGLDARAALAIDCPQVPEIDAGSGSVEELAQDARAWRATYRPPRGAIPQVAILSVFCGDEPAILPIPLWGDGDAEVHSTPHKVVSVRIGNDTFGPLRTDAAGIARVPVVVPPGVGFAYQGQRAIDLHVPATRTVHLVSRLREVAVDQARVVPVWAFVVDRSGAPLASAPLRTRTTRGALAAPVQVAPGIYRLDWWFEAGRPGLASVEASVEGDPEPATIDLALTEGAPASIELTADRRRIHAGDGPVHLHAVVRDAAGNVLQPTLVARAAIGLVHVEGSDITVELPGPLNGNHELRVEVSAGAARAETAIALLPASPASVRIVAARRNVLADGRSGVSVRLRTLDKFGNDVADPPAASADVGSLTPPTRTGTGWEATFVPPLLHDRESALLNARTGEAKASARIELDPAVRPLAFTFRAGVFSNLHEIVGPTAGLVAAVRTDLFDAQLGAQLSLDAIGWNTTDTIQLGAQPRDLRTSLGVILPGLSAELRRPLSDRTTVWVEGGPVLGIVTSGTEVTGSSSQRDRGLSPGAQAGVGAEMRAWRGRALVELRWIALRRFSLFNLTGTLDGLCATAGYRLELF